jgi:hypothetical protein
MGDPVGFAGGSEPKPEKKKRGTVRKRSTRTARVKVYARELLKGKSKKAAALAAGYSEAMASQAGARIERPNQEYFERLMDRFIPDELLATKVREGLESTVVKTATFEGEITDEREYADMPTRARYIELAAEFKGRVRRGAGDTQVNMPIMLVHGVPRPERATTKGTGQVNGNGNNGG